MSERSTRQRRVTRKGAKNEAKGEASETLILNRRNFLMLGAAASAAAACSPTSGTGSTFDTANESLIPNDVTPDFAFNVVRRDDFLTLRFEFYNLVPNALHTGLQRKAAGEAFIIVTFPPQHVFEATFLENTPAPSDPPVTTPPETPPVGTRIAGPSRVSFVVPNTIANVPLTLSGLLQLMGQLDMHLAVNALPAGERTGTDGATQTSPIVLNPTLNTGGSPLTQVFRFQRDLFASVFFPLLTAPPPPASPGTSVSGAAPHEPFNHETAIELPFRLYMSPDRFGAWAHAPAPITANGRTEIWHTRLGVRNATTGAVDETNPLRRRMRALWTRDKTFTTFDPGSPNDTTDPADIVFSGIESESLTGNDRTQIVHLSSNFEHFTDPATPANPEPLPVPVHVNRLMLTALGGWLDLKGEWSDPALHGLDLEEWQHKATFGRDNYVKVVKAGVLYPFGHRASLVKVTERKLKSPDHPHIAFLRTRFFIIVREPAKLYTEGRSDTATDTNAKNLRQIPFAAIRIKSLVTPSLDIDNNSHAFVPRVNGTRDAASPTGYSGGIPFRFSFEGLDHSGNVIRFTAPVAWVPKDDPDPFTTGQTVYATPSLDPDRVCPTAGQRVAYAPPSKPDDTTHETHDVTFDAALAAPGTYLPATFTPIVTQATVAVEALRHVVGATDSKRLFKYAKDYADNGFNAANTGEVMLQLVDLTQKISVSTAKKSDRSGGFLNPDASYSALSRKIGPVAGDIATAVNGDFDPTKFFPDTAMIFGVVPISKILDLAGIKLDKAPKFLTKILTRALGIVADVEKLADDLKSVSLGAGVPPLPAIQTLLDDLKLAFDPSSSQQGQAAARIPNDVNAVVTGLSNVSTALGGMAVPVQPRAFAADMITRAANLASSLPGTVTEIVAQIAALTSGAEFPKEIHTRLEWRGRVAPFLFFVPRNPETLLLIADIRASAQGGGSAAVDLKCALEDFDLKLIEPSGSLNFVNLHFNSIEFTIKNGKKPDISVDFQGMEFVGALSFVQKLKDLIPLQGFTDPPNLQVDASGITAGFTLAIPNIGVGVFSLENINLGAALHVPFIGGPLTFSFNFSTRENPFNLTVALLGGGGFFGLTLTPNGLQLLEASLEAGARISIDLVVASGSVSAAIGVYFRMTVNDAGKSDILLQGYFRIRGQLDVLGIISVSVEMMLSLSYESDTHKLTGRASIEVDIDILFFSASVTVSCERRFAGSNGDPTFFDIMHPAGDFRPWDDYVAAFAA